jgi:hypothetical protein
MKKLVGLIGLALMLSFGVATVVATYATPVLAGEEKKDEKKKGGGHLFDNEKKDEKKDKKGK